MRRRMSANEMMKSLPKEKINTWFDLGLFIDRFKENNPVPTIDFQGSYRDFKHDIRGHGLAFVTFYYAIPT